MITLQRKNVLKSGAGVYQIPGLIGIITFGQQILPEGASWPETLSLDGFTAKTVTAAVKMTPEERAAARAAMTPEQKLAEQEARLQKQAENLAARKAKLAEQLASAASQPTA